jgi:hypothetical protein
MASGVLRCGSVPVSFFSQYGLNFESRYLSEMAHQAALSVALEQLLTIESLPTDVNIVANLRGDSMLPLSALTDHRQLRATPEELVSACESFRLIHCPDPCIVLPFFVEPRIVIISNLPNDAKQSEFRKFVAVLLGHTFFEVHPHTKGAFKVKFADAQTALCVWRALKYCAFEDSFLNCVPVALNVRIAEDEKVIPNPRRKTPTTGRVYKRKKEKMRANPQMPAALPIAMAGNGDLPQAVVLELRASNGK